MRYSKTVLGKIQQNYELVQAGKDISIPFPFERFGRVVPGIQQGRYYIVTANSKVGKTKLTDFLFLYNPIEWLAANDSNITTRIFYFTLEMSKDDKYMEALAYRIYKKYGKVIPPDVQLNMLHRRRLSKAELELLQRERPYLEMLEDRVHFISHLRTPEEIYAYMKRYANRNGYYIGASGARYEGRLLDNVPPQHVLDDAPRYVPDDPDEYVIVITDHVSLLSGKGTLHANMGKWSSDYCLRLRDRYKYIPVNVQQQAASQESVEHRRADMLQPSANGLGDNKMTQRDCDMMLGLFAPSRYDFKQYKGYDLEMIGDYYRELIVIFNRRGPAMNTSVFFAPAVNWFEQLPKSDDDHGMRQIYNKVAFFDAQ